MPYNSWCYLERIRTGKKLASWTFTLWGVALGSTGLYAMLKLGFSTECWLLLMLGGLALGISFVSAHESEWRQMEPEGSWIGHHADRIRLHLWHKVQR